MSTSSSRRRRRQKAREFSEAAAYEQSKNYLVALSGFEGGNQSSRRGWIYWPTLDSKKELSTFSRTEMLRKSRWLRANFGLPNRICSGLSDMIGYLTPLSMSGDEEWDELADAHWEERTAEAMVVDAASQFNIAQLQIELNKAAFGDGDVLPVLIQGSTGGIMVAMYEAPQLANPDGATEGWVDGVRINKFRRHLAYGLRNEEQKITTVAARDALYYSHPDAMARVRPPTALKHAINHLIDISEILADTKLTIKVAAQLGLYLKNQQANSGGFQGARSIMSGLRNEQQTEGDGTDENPERSVKIEDIYQTAGGVANLPKGMDIGVIQDTRPHPNQLNLLEYLVRDIAWGVGVAPEILWNIEKLRGANNRLVNADLDRWISCRLLRLRAWMRRFRAIWIANEIEAGRLPEPAGSAKFWRATFLPQASLTADKGRLGQLNIDLVRNSMRSLATHFAEDGAYWLRELRQISYERRKMGELGIALADITPAHVAGDMRNPQENTTDLDP